MCKDNDSDHFSQNCKNENGQKNTNVNTDLNFNGNNGANKLMETIMMATCLKILMNNNN